MDSSDGPHWPGPGAGEGFCLGDAGVFRLEGWAGSLIVSENIKQALERVGATGVKFEEV
jgi:hypothetical protein